MIKEEESSSPSPTRVHKENVSRPVQEPDARRQGRTGIVVRRDFVDHLYIASTTPTYSSSRISARSRRKVHTIPEASLTSKGKPVVHLINLEKDERITAVPTSRTMRLTGSSSSRRRKPRQEAQLDLLRNIRSTGIKAITLPDDDSLISSSRQRETEKS
jgi:DNA gyrase subunit A